MRRRMFAVLFACLTVGAAASVAWAAVGDGGTIKTCFKASTATWRPIDSSASCKSGESQLDFYSKSGADATFLGKTAKAADSDKLDGIDSTGFLGATAKAADSDKLDGIDSTGFVQGGGRQTKFSLTASGGFYESQDVGQLISGCSGFTRLRFRARSSSSVSQSYDLWRDLDGSSVRTTLAAGDDLDTDFLSGGIHHVVFRAIRADGHTGQWDLFVDANTCNVFGVVTEFG